MKKKPINLDDKIEISATIVVYKEDFETLLKTINCFLNTPLIKKLYLVDNSPTNALKEIVNQPEIEYIFTGQNIGFGSAHNLIISKLTSKFHLILNPDVIFKPQVLPSLINELNRHKNVSMISPKVVSPNGKLQYTSRENPSLIELFFRRIGIFKTYTRKKEYRDRDLSKTFSPDFIHGCFMLFKTTDFKHINGFDKRYFLYMEDVDICRRIKNIEREILYYPKQEIVHNHRRGSSKNPQLLFYHLASSIKYFKKWRN